MISRKLDSFKKQVGDLDLRLKASLGNLKVSEHIKDLIIDKEKQETGKKQEAKDTEVISALVNAGCSDEEIKTVYKKYPIGAHYCGFGNPYLGPGDDDGAPYTSQSIEYKDRYLNGIIKKAKQV